MAKSASSGSRRRGKGPVPGDVVEIRLNGNDYCYGRVLENPLMAFYNVRAATPLTAQEVVRTDIAFVIWVMNSAVKSGRWKVIGNAPVEPRLAESPRFCKQDPISKKLYIYRHGLEEPATLEQCRGLERNAVWSAEHVESRLDDVTSGKPNQWAEALKIRR